MEIAIAIVLGCCALGAGIAMIAGIGPAIVAPNIFVNVMKNFLG